MATRRGEVNLGKSELGINANMTARLRFCLDRARLLEKFFKAELNIESRGMALPVLNAKEMHLLKSLRVELEIALRAVNRLISDESIDIRT